MHLLTAVKIRTRVARSGLHSGRVVTVHIPLCLDGAFVWDLRLRDRNRGWHTTALLDRGNVQITRIIIGNRVCLESEHTAITVQYTSHSFPPPISDRC